MGRVSDVQLQKTDLSYSNAYGIFNDGGNGIAEKLLASTSRKILDSSGRVISQVDEATGKVTRTSYGATATGVQEVTLHDSASPAVDDVIFEKLFKGKNNAAEEVEYARVRVLVKNVGNGTEEAWFQFAVMNAGTLDADAFEVRVVAGVPTLYVGGAEVSGASAFSGARVYKSGTQTLSTSVALPGTAITFDSERYDTDLFHDTGSNTSRLTIPQTGYYSIKANIAFDNGTSGRRYGTLLVDGTTIIDRRLHAFGDSADVIINLSTDYFLTAGQYVEVYARQESGGNLDIVNTSNGATEFMIHLIGV